MTTVSELRKEVQGKWRAINLVHIYRLTRAGLTEVEICNTLGVTRQALWYWCKRRPEINEALELARKERKDATLVDWVYQRLAPDLKVVWDNIIAWDKEKNGVEKIELLLNEQGRAVRQQLFLHALATSNFNASEAMRIVNINKRILDSWLSSSTDFARLIEEVQWHKANFFEDGLVNLVKLGNPGATIFANKNINASRGYAKPTEVNMNVSGSIGVGVFDLSELIPYLKEETRLEIMQALREVDKAKVVDSESNISQKLAETITRTNGEALVSGKGVT